MELGSSENGMFYTSAGLSLHQLRGISYLLKKTVNAHVDNPKIVRARAIAGASPNIDADQSKRSHTRTISVSAKAARNPPKNGPPLRTCGVPVRPISPKPIGGRVRHSSNSNCRRESDVSMIPVRHQIKGAGSASMWHLYHILIEMPIDRFMAADT